MKWLVESLRFTAFMSQDARPKAGDWWNAAMGVPPEAHTERLREGYLQDEGPLDKGRVVLSVSPPRIDWVYGLEVKSLGPSLESVPNLGPYESVVPQFLEIARKWLPDSPPITRIAYGAVLSIPVADRLQGYKDLAAFLHFVKVDPEGSADMLFQVNRHRKSKVIPELRINRLSKWSVLQFQHMNIQIVGNSGSIVPGTPGSELSACRLELDINSAAENQKDLPKNFLEPLLSEYAGMVEEICNKGDVA